MPERLFDRWIRESDVPESKSDRSEGLFDRSIRESDVPKGLSCRSNGASDVPESEFDRSEGLFDIAIWAIFVTKQVENLLYLCFQVPLHTCPTHSPLAIAHRPLHYRGDIRPTKALLDNHLSK